MSKLLGWYPIPPGRDSPFFCFAQHFEHYITSSCRLSYFLLLFLTTCLTLPNHWLGMPSSSERLSSNRTSLGILLKKYTLRCVMSLLCSMLNEIKNKNADIPQPWNCAVLCIVWQIWSIWHLNKHYFKTKKHKERC